MSKISIIMPVYNSEKYVKKSIMSVLAQSYKDFELIIIDDHSTDDTVNICKEMQMKDQRIKILYNSGKGVSSARNTGINFSKSEYLTFIDSDDYYVENAIEIMINSIRDAEIIICNYNNIKKNGFLKNKVTDLNNIEKKEYFFSFLHHYNLFNPVWNKIYRKDIIKINKIFFNEAISIAEDLEFNLKYFETIKRIKYVNEPLYNYRISNSGLNYSYNLDRIKIRKKLYEYEKNMFKNNGYDLELIMDEYLKICFSELKHNKYQINKINEILLNESRNLELKEIISYGNKKQRIIAFCLNKKIMIILINICMKFLKM